MTIETERTYLEMLQAELAQARAKRTAAAEKLADDDPEYLQKVLAGWDYVIGQIEARIARESAR
jgi:hypothetical protein